MAKTAKEEENQLLMPMATAVWLIDNTALTFKQISDFTGLDPLQVEAIADGEVGRGIVGRDPVEHGELSRDVLDKAIDDPKASLVLAKKNLPPVRKRSKGPRYTPVSKRGDKPDAIAYILKNASDIKDTQIAKLIGTTKNTINNVRNRTHPNQPNIRPRHPAELGLCTYAEFEAVHNKALRDAGKDPEAVKAEKQQEAEKEAQPFISDSDDESGGFDFSNFLGDNYSSGSE